MLQIVQKRYCASMSGATAPKLHPRDATWVVRDGAVGFLFIRMPWEDNRGDEVVVWRMIICDSVNLKRRKLKIASTRLTK
mmetsp:Transcript_23526/g.34908  ORF Transcript_23526/g.34908 Transcript_23526/m.34908 type:complete len:80 (+) Transcript_23526:599-838(+)